MSGMSTNIGHLQKHLMTWYKYRDIWETQKDPFILSYQKRNNSVTSFEADINRHLHNSPKPCQESSNFCRFYKRSPLCCISRYTERISDVELEDTVTCIRFVKLDCSPLKAALVHHCNDWQTRLTELLTHTACTGLKELHKSMHSNAEK